VIGREWLTHRLRASGWTAKRWLLSHEAAPPPVFALVAAAVSRVGVLPLRAVGEEGLYGVRSCRVVDQERELFAFRRWGNSRRTVVAGVLAARRCLVRCRTGGPPRSYSFGSRARVGHRRNRCGLPSASIPPLEAERADVRREIVVYDRDVFATDSLKENFGGVLTTVSTLLVPCRTSYRLRENHWRPANRTSCYTLAAHLNTGSCGP